MYATSNCFKLWLFVCFLKREQKWICYYPGKLKIFVETGQQPSPQFQSGPVKGSASPRKPTMLGGRGWEEGRCGA